MTHEIASDTSIKYTQTQQVPIVKITICWGFIIQNTATNNTE